VGTTLLMARLLWLSSRLQGRPEAVVSGLAAPWLAWMVVGLVLPWGLVRALALPADWTGLATAAGPVLLGLVLAMIASRVRMQAPAIPPGDLVVPVERMLQVLTRLRRPL
jgi:hypothetical protein